MIFPEKEIHIYQTNLSKHFPHLKKFEEILSKDELEKAYRYKFEKDKNNYIIGRAILRKLLGKYTGKLPSEINFSYAAKGKPYLENSKLKFNLSHSNDFIIYAFANEKEIGVDVEFVKEMSDALEIAERFFSEEEIEVLKKIDTAEIKIAFFNCWTRKEAFIKAIGEGLSYPLKNFSVILKPECKPEIIWIKGNKNEAMEWSLFNLDVEENYIASLAVREKKVKILNFKI